MVHGQLVKQSIVAKYVSVAELVYLNKFVHVQVLLDFLMRRVLDVKGDLQTRVLVDSEGNEADNFDPASSDEVHGGSIIPLLQNHRV